MKSKYIRHAKSWPLSLLWQIDIWCSHFLLLFAKDLICIQPCLFKGNYLLKCLFQIMMFVLMRVSKILIILYTYEPRNSTIRFGSKASLETEIRIVGPGYGYYLEVFRVMFRRLGREKVSLSLILQGLWRPRKDKFFQILSNDRRFS